MAESVLVVDDDEEIALYCEMTLRAAGFQVTKCFRGDEALRLIESKPFDIVLSDMQMPGKIDGRALVKAAKVSRPALPVLIMSIHDEELYAHRVLKAGASGYLMKNSVPEELIGAIRRITAGGKYISPAFAERLASEFASPEKSLHEQLSDREFQIMCLIASGKSLKEIGGMLCISGKTVTTYRARILDKMHMKTNADLVGYVLQNKLTE
jgi:two-component system invasion response regulator UvrY